MIILVAQEKIRIFPKYFSFGGNEKIKLQNVALKKCGRFCAARLPHLSAVLKLSVSPFQKPKFYQNPLRSDGVNKVIK